MFHRAWLGVENGEASAHATFRQASWSKSNRPLCTGTRIRAQAVWRGHPFHVVFELDAEDPVLAVTIDTPDREKPLPWKPGWAGTMLMTYPYAFHHETAGAESVVPVDEGVIYPTREVHTTADPRRWRPWWLHQKLSMPWWGVTSGDARRDDSGRHAL